jgi:hypothetical protein
MSVQLLGHIFQNNLVMMSHPDGFNNNYLGIDSFIPLQVGQTVLFEQIE